MDSAQFGLELRAKHAEDRRVAACNARITAGDDPSLTPPFDPINPWNHMVIGRSTSTQPPPPSPNLAIPISDPWYLDAVIPACEQEIRYRFWFETHLHISLYGSPPRNYQPAHWRWFDDAHANGHLYEAAMFHWRASRTRFPRVLAPVQELILEFTRLPAAVWESHDPGPPVDDVSDDEMDDADEATAAPSSRGGDTTSVRSGFSSDDDDFFYFWRRPNLSYPDDNSDDESFGTFLDRLPAYVPPDNAAAVQDDPSIGPTGSSVAPHNEH